MIHPFTCVVDGCVRCRYRMPTPPRSRRAPISFSSKKSDSTWWYMPLVHLFNCVSSSLINLMIRRQTPILRPLRFGCCSKQSGDCCPSRRSSRTPHKRSPTRSAILMRRARPVYFASLIMKLTQIPAVTLATCSLCRYALSALVLVRLGRMHTE